jgi:hypothetical protein
LLVFLFPLVSAMYLDVWSFLSLNIKTRRSPAGSLKKILRSLMFFLLNVYLFYNAREKLLRFARVVYARSVDMANISIPKIAPTTCLEIPQVCIGDAALSSTLICAVMAY